MTLYKNYTSTLKPTLKKELGKNNTHEVPSLDKVVVSVGIGSLATRK